MGGSAQEMTQRANTTADSLHGAEKGARLDIPRLLPKPEAIIEERREQWAEWWAENWQRRGEVPGGCDAFPLKVVSDLARAPAYVWALTSLQYKDTSLHPALRPIAMAPLEGLSDAHAILLATNLCASGHIAALPALQAQYPHCFPLERLLRIILTFLPESTQPSDYAPVLQNLTSGTESLSSTLEIDSSTVQDLSESAARKRVRKLRLRPLKREDEEEDIASSDPLTQFIIHRSYLIDSETALQPLILGLLLPFYAHNAAIRTWLVSSLLPALRLNYEYYPNREETLSLETLELMDDQTAVNVLLSITGTKKNDMDLVNNLRGLVGPWLHGSNRSKRRRLNEAARQNTISFIQGTPKPETTEFAGWEYVNEWLLSRSSVDHEAVANAFINWNGPEDVDMGGYESQDATLATDKAKELLNRYGQSGLAVVYGHMDSSKPALERSFKVLGRVAELLSLEECSYLDATESTLPSVDYDTELLSSSTRGSLMQNTLLKRDNPLTKPSPSSISFLSALLLSLRILTGFGQNVPCRSVANLCLFSSEELQLTELRNVVGSTVAQARSRQQWEAVREHILWLRDWQADQSDNGWDKPSTHQGLFWRVPRDTVETEVLKAFLGAKGRIYYHLQVFSFSADSSQNINSLLTYILKRLHHR